MPKRLIIVPRWGGMPTSDWYPWLKQKLEREAPALFTPIVAAAMPHPNNPTIKEWVARIEELMGTDEDQRAQTILLSHSVGCRAILHWLATVPQGQRIAGIYAVAGWWNVVRSWDTLIPWITDPIDLDRVRKATDHFVTLISDNDPFTPNWAANRDLWVKQLGARVYIDHGSAHFNGERYPMIFQVLMEQFGS